VIIGEVTDRQTDTHTDTSDFIICPMQCYSNRTDNDTNWKHCEELKWLHVTASVLSIHEARYLVSTKQLRKYDHQQHSAKHQAQNHSQYIQHSTVLNTKDTIIVSTLNTTQC